MMYKILIFLISVLIILIINVFYYASKYDTIKINGINIFCEGNKSYYSYNAYLDEHEGFKSVTIKAKKDCYLGLNIETYSDYDSHEADVDYLIIKVLEV